MVPSKEKVLDQPIGYSVSPELVFLRFALHFVNSNLLIYWRTVVLGMYQKLCFPPVLVYIVEN